MITRAQIDKATFENVFHGNMGYVPDETVERHKGYIYGFQCNEFARFQMTHSHYLLDDGRVVVEYFVDGQKVKDLDAVVDCLNKPVDLTFEERRVLRIIPETPIDLKLIEDMIAGCERPDGATVMPNTPHAYAFDMIDRLRSKGVVKVGRREWDPPAVDDEGLLADPLFAHLRFTPTIMRVG